MDGRFLRCENLSYYAQCERIAEGYERNSNPDFKRFLYIAKGSLSELLTQLEIAKEIGFVSAEDFAPIQDQCRKIGAMLTKLIASRQ